jgi:hypothetical protein
MGDLLGTCSRRGKFRKILLGLPVADYLVLQGQYVDGFRTPFVLHPPREVQSYDEEFTVILGDWYHEQHHNLLSRFLSIANPGGAEPVPGKLMHLLTNR